MDILQDKNLLDLNVNEEAKSTLSTIAQWTNIYAILGFVSLGLSVISTFVAMGKAGRYGSNPGGSLFSLLITVGISLLLNINLYAAAKNIKLGLASSDQGFFNLGMQKLATYFRILGIIMIVVLLIVALAVLIIVLAGAATNRY